MQPLNAETVKIIDITSSCHNRFVIIFGTSHSQYYTYAPPQSFRC
jgi:hypothetical protein